MDVKRANYKDVLHKEALSCMFVRPTVAHIAHLPLQELRLAASPHSRLVHLPLLEAFLHNLHELRAHNTWQPLVARDTAARRCQSSERCLKSGSAHLELVGAWFAHPDPWKPSDINAR